jgi:hypothetical protein
MTKNSFRYSCSKLNTRKVPNGCKTSVIDVTRFLCVSLGSSIVQLHKSLGKRRACSKVGFSSQKATVLEECTTEEQRSLVRFLWAKRLNAEDIHREMFPIYGRNCLSPKAAHKLGDKRFANDEEVETEVQNWLRLQPKNFYAAGFDALVKRWDKCIQC